MKIGIITGSMKPIHKGHWNLIMTAAQECDIVKLFVSLSGRGCVSASSMSQVWEECLKEHLPSNVELEFVDIPGRSAYQLMGAYDKQSANVEFCVYSDPADINKMFSADSLNKYLPFLFTNSLISFVRVSREGDNDISSTMMRDYINTGNRRKFIKNVPECVEGNKVWNIITKK